METVPSRLTGFRHGAVKLVTATVSRLSNASVFGHYICLLSRRSQVRVLSGAWLGIPLFAGVSGLLHSAYTTFCRVRITAIRTFFGSKRLPKRLPASGRRPRLEQLLGKLQLNRSAVHDPRTRTRYAEGGKQTFPVHASKLPPNKLRVFWGQGQFRV